jgi:hypothetical protein
MGTLVRGQRPSSMGGIVFFHLYQAHKYVLMSWYYCHSEILSCRLLFLLVSLAITCTAAGHGGVSRATRRETSLTPAVSPSSIRAGGIDSYYVWPWLLPTPRCARQKSEKRVSCRGLSYWTYIDSITILWTHSYPNTCSSSRIGSTAGYEQTFFLIIWN